MYNSLIIGNLSILGKGFKKTLFHSPPCQVDVMPFLTLQGVTFGPLIARRLCNIGNATSRFFHQLCSGLIQLACDRNISIRLKNKISKIFYENIDKYINNNLNVKQQVRTSFFHIALPITYNIKLCMFF